MVSLGGGRWLKELALPAGVYQYRLVVDGRSEEVREPAQRMRRIGEVIGTLEFPHNVAAAMEARGREVGTPKSITSAQTRVRYAALRETMRTLLRDWGYAPLSA